MELWQAGDRHPLHVIGELPVAVTELAHRQPRALPAMSAATAEAEPTPILDLANQDWVHEAAYPEPELDLDAAADPRDPIQPLPEFEQAPPHCPIYALLPFPEIAERWLDRSLAAPRSRPAVPALAALCAPPAALDPSPALSGDFMAMAAAEPVAAWLRSSDAAAPMAFAPAILLPAALDGIDTVTVETVPEPRADCLPVPPAEPVAAWLRSSDAAAPMALAPALLLPAALASIAAVALDTAPELCADCLPVPAAEPVTAWLAPSDAAAPMAFVPALLLPAAPASIAAAESPAAGTPENEPALAEPAAQPALGQPASAPALPALPALTIAAELEPLPIPDEPLEIPALCERPLPALRPEPAWRFLTLSASSELGASIPPARPVMAAQIAPTHVPLALHPVRVPRAEPVMAGVWPRIAETALQDIPALPACRLPEAAALPGTLSSLDPVPATAATLAAPAPAQAAHAAAHTAPPAAASVALRMPAAGFGVSGNQDALARPAAAPEAAPANIPPAAAASGHLAPTPPVALPSFDLESHDTAAIESSALRNYSAAPAPPERSAGRLVELRPVSTIRLALPEQRQKRPTPAIPKPGLIAVEYHMQRTRNIAYSRPEWKSVCYDPLPPAFTLRAILESPEELIKPKAPLAGVFPINTRKTLVTRSAVMEHILRVAAAVLIVTSIWFGAAALKNARRVTVRPEETAFATPNRVLTPESQRAATGKAGGGNGPLNWMRHTIANRASVQVAEDFQGDMRKWGGEAGTLPANWQRNRDGYVQTGALAVFAPTAKYTDYKLEFFGQIENRSVGWVVRAKDTRNYHAMKFTMLERGLRPVIAMVHYDVIDGQPGRRTQIPLNVMVHNNRPFQVAVTVKGRRFTTEVDGEEVDSYREDALPVGGVGFFSDAGERARLYWARVTKNDDWLGHVCAFLSGGESQTSAELWPPSIPGGAPAPWPAGNDSTILTAAWLGLPSIRRTQSQGRQASCNR